MRGRATLELAGLWPPTAACYLCGLTGPLCRSHIIPKFVRDWLREGNITGRMRGMDVPNRLTEDLPWRYLLCERCEGLFSQDEAEICGALFRPLHDRQCYAVRYGPAFARFAVSVTWRTLVQLRREGHLGNLAEIPERLDETERTWREFLLGLRLSRAPHDVHILPLDVPTSGDVSDFGSHFNRYVLRTVGQSTHHRPAGSYIIVKMARFLVFGTVSAGTERRDWRDTKIHAEGGAWGVDGIHVPGWVRRYLKDGAARVQAAVEGISDKQKQQTFEALREAMRKDPAGVASSGAFRAFEEDLAMFGREAFQKPFPTDPNEAD